LGLPHFHYSRAIANLDRAFTGALELQQHDALELPQTESAIAHRHRHGGANERAEHMGPNVISRVVDVTPRLGHEAVKDAQQVLGDALFVGQYRQSTGRVHGKEVTGEPAHAQRAVEFVHSLSLRDEATPQPAADLAEDAP